MESLLYDTIKRELIDDDFKTPVKHKKIRRPGMCRVCGKFFNDSSAIYTHMRIHTGEKPFVCNVCGRGFNQNSNLKRHLKSHRGEKPFYCGICDKKYTFQSRPYFQQHMLSHSGEKPFACEQCDKTYSFKSSLINHIKSHAKKYSFICDICHAGFSCQGRLNSHMRIHDADGKAFMCDLCMRVFTKISNRNAHLANSHNILTAYECKVCSKRYSNQQDMRMHQKEHKKKNTSSAKENKKRRRSIVPEQEKSDLSDDCVNQHENKLENIENKAINISSVLTSTSFVKNFITPEQPELLSSRSTINYRFLCGICQTEFTSMTEINQHVKMHLKSEKVSLFHNEDSFNVIEKEPKNVCVLTSDCDIEKVKSSEQLEFLSYGLVNHRFFCGVCEKQFESVTEMNEHAENHIKRENVSVTPESEIFNCTESESKDVCILKTNTDCKKVITAEQLQLLLSHGQVTHRFMCGVCEKVFDCVTDLNKHLHTHTNGENLFICGLCNESFSSGDKLKSHLNSTHIMGKDFVKKT